MIKSLNLKKTKVAFERFHEVTGLKVVIKDGNKTVNSDYYLTRLLRFIAAYHKTQAQETSEPQHLGGGKTIESDVASGVSKSPYQS